MWSVREDQEAWCISLGPAGQKPVLLATCQLPLRPAHVLVQAMEASAQQEVPVRPHRMWQPHPQSRNQH